MYSDVGWLGRENVDVSKILAEVASADDFSSPEFGSCSGCGQEQGRAAEARWIDCFGRDQANLNMQRFPTSPRIIIFDFDGVIVESNAIKDQAFFKLYLPYGESIARSAHELHLSNSGASRFEKFALIHKVVLGREITPAESQDFGQRFRSLCFDAVCACPMIPGAEQFLNTYAGRIGMALASATPEEELVAILKKRDLTRYFRHTCGKPRSKLQNLNYILASEKLTPDQAVFVGDQPSDRDAALEAAIPFIRRVEDSSNTLTADHSITNLMELSELLVLRK